MRPKKPHKSNQENLFKTRLDQILNPKHPLFILANQLDWSFFEHEFGVLFVASQGRPALPVRLVVGLHYLKHTFNESDESVVERFLENPYWQYFCGFEYFQHQFPLDPSSLVRWRKRIGPDGIEKLLFETIRCAKRERFLKKNHLSRVNVDTSVQEKAVAFPTDARLYQKMRTTLVRAAKERGVDLRQSFERLGKRALRKQGGYRHARQMKRASRETRKLKTYLGRVYRDVQRKCPRQDEKLAELLALASRILSQQRHGKNKVYSVHAPEVECIAKGKVHKKYEFGCKVAMVSTSKDNWIVGMDALHGNPYDGHTLKKSLDQVTRLTSWQPTQAYCDKGYRGAEKRIMDVQVNLANRRKRSMSRWEWKWFRRRSAIEPIFGHLKSDNRLERNYLRGRSGDRMNAMLSGCGFNMRKLLRAFLWPIWNWLWTNFVPNNYNLCPRLT